MNLPAFFADECCPGPLVRALRAMGYDVEYVIEGNVGLDDIDQAKRAFDLGCVLITADYDFGELAIRYSQPFTGLVILAPSLKLEAQADAAAVAARINGLVTSLAGRLTILGQDQVRQRPL